MKLRRSRAADLIDKVRAALAARQSPEDIEAMLARQYGIEPLKGCNGAAHDNPYIDNCGTCMPRWGWTGEKVGGHLAVSDNIHVGASIGAGGGGAKALRGGSR